MSVVDIPCLCPIRTFGFGIGVIVSFPFWTVKAVLQKEMWTVICKSFIKHIFYVVMRTGKTALGEYVLFSGSHFLTSHNASQKSSHMECSGCWSFVSGSCKPFLPKQGEGSQGLHSFQSL